jgi:hypothetical protein
MRAREHPFYPRYPRQTVLQHVATGSTEGESEVLSNQRRNFRLASVTYLGACSARPRVGVVAATGTELRHLPRIEVRAAPLAAGSDHPVPWYDHQPRRQHFPTRVAHADRAVLDTAGLDPRVTLAAEGAGHISSPPVGGWW